MYDSPVLFLLKLLTRAEHDINGVVINMSVASPHQSCGDNSLLDTVSTERGVTQSFVLVAAREFSKGQCVHANLPQCHTKSKCREVVWGRRHWWVRGRVSRPLGLMSQFGSVLTKRRESERLRLNVRPVKLTWVWLMNLSHTPDIHYICSTMA